jgi:hypothetical protein
MTDYTIRINNVPADVPEDVLIEHVAVAARKISKDRKKEFKRIDVKLLEKAPTRKPRQHPFDGPEVNDDPPMPDFALGGYVTGVVPRSTFDRGYVVPEGSITFWNSATSVFDGPNREDWTPDTGIVASVPEPEYTTVEVDVDDIVNEVYRAIGEDFPNLAELFRAKREERELHRAADAPEPPAEGDWELSGDDKVGEDL